ncbi:DnaD domain-containing protein [Staphylococcus equorum]|uniref:DnaD domain-containing protein n=1 Tax=Staphylococcus equorum TaxID=246432 RepID=UPI000D1C3CF7|nr:DnaD domain protein [Staphylococcus equorum]PTE43391.1 DNA replication protein DnaD [Staphylococcus equorum]RIL46381.1 DnaD domain protein [Staphylococcus equorum]
MTESVYIPGGYILLSRKIIESEIWSKPPMYLKVWIYILTKARYTSNNKFERGELLLSIPEVQEACSHKVGYRIEKPTKAQIYNIIDWLRSFDEKECGDNDEDNVKGTMITTNKTTRGLVCKVHNYSVYQDPKNYEDNVGYNFENSTNETMKSLRRQRQANTIHKNVKKEKKDKNEKKQPQLDMSNNNRSIGDDDTYSNPTHVLAFEFFQQNGFGMLNPYISDQINSWMAEFPSDGDEILVKAMQEAVNNNVKRWNYVNGILKRWLNSGAKTLADVEALMVAHNSKNKQKQSSESPYVKIIEEARNGQ